MPKQKYTKRKDGRYATTFRGQTVYARTSKELEDKVNEMNYLSKTGLLTDDKKITFKEYASNYMILQKRLEPKKSHSRDEGLLSNHIYPVIGLIEIKQLRKTNIQHLKATMIEKGLTEKVNRALSLIKNILNSAVDDNVVVKNVAINIKNYTFEKNERQILTSYEDNLLLEVAKQHKYGLFFLFIRYCGLRPEEVRALKIENINIEKSYVDVYDAISFVKSEQGDRKDTKNLVHREVPILDFMMPLVVSKMDESKNLGTDLLFYKQTNPKQHMSKSSYKSCVKSFLSSVNQLNKENPEQEIERIEFIPYQLRHSYCTMLYYSGVSLKEAQSLMGHKSSKMVLDIYTHLKKEEENTQEKLNTYFDFNNMQLNKNTELQEIDVRMWLSQDQKSLVKSFLIMHKIKYKKIKS